MLSYGAVPIEINVRRALTELAKKMIIIMFMFNRIVA